jgi:hypothetical protein
MGRGLPQYYPSGTAAGGRYPQAAQGHTAMPAVVGLLRLDGLKFAREFGKTESVT